MKKFKNSVILFFFSLPFSLPGVLLAHCPASLKEETACFMLEKNLVYVYDQKVEHNGPYKDLTAELKFVDSNGKTLAHERVARGIFKILAPKILSGVTAVVKLNNKIQKKVLIKGE